MKCDEKETPQQPGVDRPSFFGQRDERLRTLGFACYADYLASDLWEFVRGSLKPIRECRVCKSSTGLAWHHRTYQLFALVGNFSDCDQFIVRLCNECHSSIHKNKDEWIDCEDEVDRRLRLLVDNFHICEGNRKAAMECVEPDWTNWPN